MSDLWSSAPHAMWTIDDLRAAIAEIDRLRAQIPVSVAMPSTTLAALRRDSIVIDDPPRLATTTIRIYVDNDLPHRTARVTYADGHTEDLDLRGAR